MARSTSKTDWDADDDAFERRYLSEGTDARIIRNFSRLRRALRRGARTIGYGREGLTHPEYLSKMMIRLIEHAESLRWFE